MVHPGCGKVSTIPAKVLVFSNLSLVGQENQNAPGVDRDGEEAGLFPTRCGIDTGRLPGFCHDLIRTGHGY